MRRKWCALVLMLVVCLFSSRQDAMVGAKSSGLASLKAADLVSLLEQQRGRTATTTSSSISGSVRTQLRRSTPIGSILRLRGGAEVKLKGAKKVRLLTTAS